MGTSVARWHSYSPLSLLPTPRPSHTQASDESSSTRSEAVASENHDQPSAYHQPASNYPHCPGFRGMSSHVLPLCNFTHSVPPKPVCSCHAANLARSPWGSARGQRLRSWPLRGSPPEPRRHPCLTFVCSLESDVVRSAPAHRYRHGAGRCGTQRPCRQGLIV